MEYRGFQIINEYKEPQPGAWRAYDINNPEVVVDGYTEYIVISLIDDIFMDRQDKEIDRLNTELLKASLTFEHMKTHLRNMMGAMDEFMSRPENLEIDGAEEYLAAAKFCNSEFGTSYRTHHVEEWIENELKKLK